MKTTAPYGTWQSRLTAQQIASGSPRMAEPKLNCGRVFWLEGRPQEQGRVAIVMQTVDGKNHDLLPAPWSARSRVHEYGGGAYAVEGNDLYFVNAACQQVYHLNLDTGAVSELTNTPDCRYGGLLLDVHKQRLIAVCEQHGTGPEPSNSLVSITLNRGSLAPVKLASGADFYAQPALSPTGKQLAFISWNHPNMPWDNSQLWVAEIAADGSLEQTHSVTAGESSVFQPSWLDEQRLLWVDDMSDWWNLYLWHKESHKTEAITHKSAEFATPLWSLDMTTYGVFNAHTLMAAYTHENRWQLVKLTELADGQWHEQAIQTDLVSISNIQAGENDMVLLGATSHSEGNIWRWRKDYLHALKTLPSVLGDADVAIGEVFQFPTANGQSAFANFYPPRNSHFEGPEDALPPAIFIGHGGPSGQADLGYSSKIQFWTQHGFAVIDVNYRGSTGFGRPYRDSLKGQWGIADVEDMCFAAYHAIDQGWVAPGKLAIRGGSAGGFTVLAALTDSNTFNAGVSLYGVGDLETLATDTHKFEGRYMDSLVGPYPEAKATYVARSPIHKAANIQCPLLVFQGLDDKVVPPNQAETMVNAVKAQGLPVLYVTYAGEAHGFRKADTIVHQLETELAFYRDTFGLGTLTAQ